MQRTVERMLRTSPEPPFAAADPLCACIHACVEGAQVCTACADACVADHSPSLSRCIRINLDCADICSVTSRILSRQYEPDLPLVSLTVQLCAAACEAAAAECGRHASTHPHCDVCAAACRRCAAACRTLLATTVHPRRMH